MDILKKLKLSEQDFIQITNLGELSDSPLGNPEAVKSPITISLKPFKLDESQISSILKLSTQLNIAHISELFNESGDKDDDQLLAVQGVEEPFIPFSDKNPVFKHALKLALNAGIEGETGHVSFGIESGAKLEHLAYLKHDGKEQVDNALVHDFTNMPFVFNLQQLFKLPVGDALAFQTEGKLGLEAEFKASDVISAGLSSLTKFIGKEELLGIELEAGPSVKVSFSVEDTYQLIILKDSATHYKVSIKKARARAGNLSPSLRIKAGFNNPDELSRFLKEKTESLLEAITGLERDELQEIEKLLIKLESGDLSEEEIGEPWHTLIQELIIRLKSGEEVKSIFGLLEKIKTIRTTAEKELVNGAKIKMEAGFGYQYSRMKSSSLLFQGVINQQVLSDQHAALISFNPGKLVAEARVNKDANAIKVLNYLNEETIKSTSGWSISLGLGKIKIESTDRKELEKKTSENLDGAVKVAYDGTRKYVGKLGSTASWWVDFDASMAAYKKDPTVADFAYGFTFILESEYPKFRKGRFEELAQLVDTAVAWNIVPKKDFDSTVADLWGQLKGKKDLKFSTQLHVKPEAVDTMKMQWYHLLLKRPVQQQELMAKAFGKAMLYKKDFAYRKDIDKREAAYGSLWLTYFQDISGKLNYRDYTRIAKDFFQEKEAVLAWNEGKYVDQVSGTTGAGDNVWFGGVIRINGNSRQTIHGFTAGLLNLLSADLNKVQPYDPILKGAFNNMAGAWEQSFHVKALGNYFINLAKAIPGSLNGIESKLEISYKDGNEEKIILLQKSA